MGTLTVASMSTFTSCKDYDDDISNLQGQIDKLATADQLSQKVAELQALISSNTSSIGTLQSALDEAKKAAEKAQTTADSKATLDQVNGILADYAKVSYVDDAKKSLNDAIEALKTGDITTLKADVEAAAKAAAAAKADAEAAIAEVKKDLENNYVTNATYKSEKEVAEAALETLKNQVETNTGNIQANADAIVKLQAVDVVTKADLVAKLGEYATAQQAKDLQKELTDLKNNFAEEIAKYALKSDLNSLATKEELQKASEKAANELQTKLNDYLKADVLASLATKDDIKDLQNKEAVQNLIKDAIQDLKDGDIKSIGDKAAEALQKANKAESTEGLAYVKALAAEGKAVAAATDAATAKSKAETNESEITTIKNILGNKFDAKNTVSAAIDLINAQLTNDKTGLAALAGRLSSIESLLNQDTPDATSLKTRVDNIENKLKDIIGQYSTMVTDVQLYNFAGYNGAVNGGVDGSYWGRVDADGHYHGNIQNGTITNGSAAPSVVPGWNTTLDFIQTEEKENVFPANAKDADKQLTFKKGKYYAGEDSLLIRVSPVDAELTTSNVSLMNSQGTELDDIIDVTDVHRFKGLLTRASSANTGLWVVKFKATDLGDKFKEAAEVDSKKVLYSVAVKNTYNTTGEEKDANTRRVTSEFGVDLKTSNVAPAVDFTVEKTLISEIHNRYVKTESIERTDMNSGSHKKTYAEELVWINPAKPGTIAITSGDDKNAENRMNHTVGNYINGVDNRQQKNILAVEKGKPIEIDFSTATPNGVKGFYVTLDEKFAQESAPSELNAWNSYTYENVGYNGKPAKLFEGNKGTITIKDMNNVEGDIIGFRVYAVNHDGTLYDPDGRAFYVAVGDVKKELNLGDSKLTINSSNEFESTVELPADFSKYDFTSFTGWTITEKDASNHTPVYGDFTVQYLDANKATVSTLDNTVKYIKFILNNPMEFIDGATYNVTTTLTKKISSATAPVCKVNASFTKVMPDDAPAFCYRDGFTKNPEYIIPDNESYVVESWNKGGRFDLRNILIINNNKYWNGIDLFDETSNGLFTFNVANGSYEWNNTDEKYDLVNADAGYPYKLYVNNRGETNLVDNKTPRAITATFNYWGISKKQNEDGSWFTGNYPVASKSKEEIVFCSWMKTFSYDITTTKKKDTDAEGNTWLKNNTVTWKKTGSTNTPKLYLDNLATKIKDVKLLPVKFPATVTKVKFGEFLTANVLEVVPGQYGMIYTTGTGTAKDQINPYFKASISGSTITLTQNSQEAIPSSVTGGLIHFTVKDCFGNTKAIELPFKINVTGVAAKKH